MPLGQVASSDHSTQVPLPPTAGGTPVQSLAAQATAFMESDSSVVPLMYTVPQVSLYVLVPHHQELGTSSGT